MTLLENILCWAQIGLLTPLAILGAHRGWLLLLLYRKRRQAGSARREIAPETLPTVTVQLPIFNERQVARRLIEAVARFDYPRDRLEIQVLDDSTDDTREIVARTLSGLPDDLRIHHLWRRERKGYKAGALAAGLEQAKGELIAVFDADFVPPSDFLLRTVSRFEDPSVGLVQTRWEHLNPKANLLTATQLLMLDAHFAIEHGARSAAGLFLNFNGTAGVFRRRCIEDAGGWSGDTLTEDLDLSYRAQLAGWRFCYENDLTCPAELPSDMNAFLNQQHRWARGSVQTAVKLLGRLLRARLPMRIKVEAAFHLLGNLGFLFLLGLILVALPLQLVRHLQGGYVPGWLVVVEGLPLLVSTICVLLYAGTAQALLGRASWKMVLRLPLVLALGAGMSLNNSLAVLGGLMHAGGEFRRTPKLGDVAGKPRYQAERGWLPYLEVALGLWATTTAVLALWLGLAPTAAFHALFAGGLLWVGGRSLLARTRSRRAIGLEPSFGG